MKHSLILAVALMIYAGVVGYSVIAREEPRPGREVVVSAQAALDAVMSDRSALLEQPLLQDLDWSWTGARFILESCGLTLTALTENDLVNLQEVIFVGPVPAWHARATGPLLPLIACFDQVNANFSVLIGQVTLEDDDSSIVYSVLGANSPPRPTF